MRQNHDSSSIVLIGAGNLATNLAKALFDNGLIIAQIYSRSEESARLLAEQVYSPYTTDIDNIITGACLYICAISDTALVQLMPQLIKGRDNSFWVHTAGSIPMDIWENKPERYGVFYPLQTFSKQREVDFRHIPLFVEANNEMNTQFLINLGIKLSDKVYNVNSAQRMKLHLSAVFACNFSNHMYTLADKLLSKENLPFDVLLPLIDETAAKIHEISPQAAQTGPAVRYDLNVIHKHLNLLSDSPELYKLYQQLSESIYKQSPKSKS